MSRRKKAIKKEKKSDKKRKKGASRTIFPKKEEFSRWFPKKGDYNHFINFLQNNHNFDHFVIILYSSFLFLATIVSFFFSQLEELLQLLQLLLLLPLLLLLSLRKPHRHYLNQALPTRTKVLSSQVHIGFFLCPAITRTLEPPLAIVQKRILPHLLLQIKETSRIGIIAHASDNLACAKKSFQKRPELF